MKPYLLFAGCLLALSLTACRTGPDYVRPEVPLPAQWTEARADTQGPVAARWWQEFGDAQLDALVAEALEGNPNLAASLHRVDRAAALAGMSRSEWFPQLDFHAASLRERRSGNTAGAAATTRTTRASLGLSWEVDLWGRVRRQVEGARAGVEAEGFRYAYGRLLLVVQVAESYFRLRVLDASLAVLEETEAGRRRTLELMAVREESGLGDALQVAQARTERASAEADLESYRRQRALAEHALGALLGRLPGAFSLPAQRDWDVRPMQVPQAVSSAWLLRRPDVQEAERLVAAASARIGASQAEYFPRLSIGTSLGYAARDVSAWFSRSSLFGAGGPEVHWSLLDGGATGSRVEAAQAEFAELTALYRAQVLGACVEVEDALASLAHLEREWQARRLSAEQAAVVAGLARSRYESGLVSFLEVVDAERTALAHALRFNETRGQHLLQGVRLVRALGGGWGEAMPSG